MAANSAHDHYRTHRNGVSPTQYKPLLYSRGPSRGIWHEVRLFSRTAVTCTAQGYQTIFERRRLQVFPDKKLVCPSPDPFARTMVARLWLIQRLATYIITFSAIENCSSLR